MENIHTKEYKTVVCTVKCSQCGSNRIFKDGLRVLSSGSEAQRFLCRDCGYRFSDKYNKECLTNSSHQLCVILQEAKKLDSATEIKTVAGESQKVAQNEKGILIEYAWKLKKRGLQENTIQLRIYLLNQLLVKGADLNDPDSVETVLATEKFTPSKKAQLVAVYRSFTKTWGISWIPIKTHYKAKQPFIPLETELDQIIAASGKRTSVLLQTLKDTAARVGEICKLKWYDIDAENLTVRINDPEKGSNSRTVKVPEKTVAMLKTLSKKYDPYIFNSNPRLYKDAISLTRKRLAQTLQNPRFKLIHLHSFRHWKATTEYQKTRDILYIMRLLGHRNIQNTLIYTQLVDFGSDHYHSAIAQNVEEARKLVESGFSFVCDMEGVKVFSKRK